MVSLRPDASVQNAIGHLDALANKAHTILGSASDAVGAFNAYLSWSVEAMRTLRTVLDAESVISLLETTGFRLIHAADPGAYSHAALGQLVRTELDAQVRTLDEVKKSLRAELLRWEFRGAMTLEPSVHIGVLDTNVLMLHGQHLPERDWNGLLDVRVGQPIVLVIPQAVIRELDRLKRANGKMRVGGKEYEQRDLARRALRTINHAFPEQQTTYGLRERATTGEVVSILRLVLQLDDLRHEALPDADAEIIDRALSLVPFGKSVTLLTGDTSMRFRAEHAGLHAVEPTWAGDEG